MATARKIAVQASPAQTTSEKAAATPAAKRVAKPAAKPTQAKPVAKAAAKPVKAPKVAKGEKPKKPKLVRDSFTIPKDEYAAIETLKQRAAKAGTPAKKSELLRAGLKLLAALPDAGFLAAVKAVPTLKTGRPAKD